MLRNSNFLFILALLVVLSYFVVADMRKECRKESKVSWAALRRFKSGNFEPEDPKLKCYLLCFMRKNGIVDQNAKVDVQRALRHLPRSMQDSSKKLFQKCKSFEGTDPCDKAYQMVKCYVKFHPEILQSVPFL